MYEVYVTLGAIGGLTFFYYFYDKRQEEKRYEVLLEQYDNVSIDSDLMRVFDGEELENSILR